MFGQIQAHEESHLKWSADVWRRARHLFGATCDEKYRAGCAQQMLIVLGHGKAGRWVRHLQAAAAVEMAAVVLAALEAVLAVVVLAVASAAAAAPPNSSRTK